MSKKCTICKVIKPLNEFVPSGKYLSSECRSCFNKKATNYARTKKGLVCRMYAHQRENSRRRRHPYPDYTLDEFRSWCFSQEIFDTLYTAWKNSGFNVELAPSANRLNDYLPYTLSNLELITAIENTIKCAEMAKDGIMNKMSKSVIQYDMHGNKIAEFYSLKHAERITKIGNGSISNTCSGRTKTAGGFIWKYK